MIHMKEPRHTNSLTAAQLQSHTTTLMIQYAQMIIDAPLAGALPAHLNLANKANHQHGYCMWVLWLRQQLPAR